MPSLLVLGGSRFVGRAIVSAAISAGWQTTVLNNDAESGVIAPEQHLWADRTDAIQMTKVLEGRIWDAVVDTWQGDPSAVRLSAKLLRNTSAFYCIISSIVVYQSGLAPPLVERSPLVAPAQIEAGSYRARKRACEMIISDAFPKSSSLIIRPGLIVGPWEYIGRLPWWLQRMHDGGSVLAPGPHARPVQWIDSRDLAAFVIECLGKVHGAINVVDHNRGFTMGCLLNLCRDITRSTANINWIDGELLEASGLRPWVELPLWIPSTNDEATAYDVNADLASDLGIRLRPPIETITDVWSWMLRLGPASIRGYLQERTWLSRSREARLLEGLPIRFVD